MNATSGRIRVVKDAHGTGVVGRYAVLLHFGAVVLLGLAIELLVDLSWALEQGEALGTAASRILPEAAGGALFVWVPIGAGVTTLFLTPSGRRGLLRLALLATGLLFAVDAVSSTGAVQVGNRSAVVAGEVVTKPVFADFSRVSFTRTARAWIAGDLEGVHERLSRYGPGHPRLRAGLALFKGSVLLLPLLIVVINAGLLAWLEREVTFSSSGARAGARTSVVWVVSIAAYAFVTWWSERGRDSAMVGAGPLTLVLLPYVPLGVVAWIALAQLRSVREEPEA